jgi:hypothetical protein
LLNLGLDIHPESDVIDGDVLASAIKVIHNPLLQLLKRGVLADLSPPLFQHILVKVASHQALTVNKFQRNLFQSWLHYRIVLIRFPNIVSLYRLTTVSFKQELPHLFVVNVEVILIIFVRLNILINELRLHALDFSSAKKILSVSIFLG